MKNILRIIPKTKNVKVSGSKCKKTFPNKLPAAKATIHLNKVDPINFS